MKRKPSPAVMFPRRDHDHALCIAGALESAAAVCSERNARLTPLRRRVLEIVWQSHKPLGAYPILDALSAGGRVVAPPTVYRALDFLVTHGLVHRIASLNAFVGCAQPGHASSAEFLICKACGNAAELSDATIPRALARAAEARGFTVEMHTVEAVGLCPNCR